MVQNPYPPPRARPCLQPVDIARAGQAVALKIEPQSSDQQSKAYGRHFDHTDALVSLISRESIDALKIYFRVSEEVLKLPLNNRR